MKKCDIFILDTIQVMFKEKNYTSPTLVWIFSKGGRSCGQHTVVYYSAMINLQGEFKIMEREIVAALYEFHVFTFVVWQYQK
jgi:hypothetical protein